jgi:prolyl oligopeptidase
MKTTTLFVAAPLWLLSALAAQAATAPPATATHDVTDTYHGTVIHDPYRWLEQADAPAVKTWIDAQNDYTEAVLSTYPGRAAIAQRVGELALTSTQRTNPVIVSDTLFYLRQTPPQPQPVLVAEGWPTGPAKVLIDPNDANGDVAITDYWPAPDGRQLAYGIAQGGDENTTIHFVDVDSAKVAVDALANTGGGTTPSALVWDADGKGVTYTRLPLPGNAPADRLQFNAALYHHVFGTPASADTVVLGKDFSPVAEYKLLASHSGALAAALVHYGDGSPEHVYLRVGGEWKLVLGTKAKVMTGNTMDDAAWDGEQLLVLSHQDAPRGKLLGIDASGSSRVLVPQQDWAMNAVAPIKGGYLVAEVSGPDWRVRHYGADGHALRTVALPVGIGIYWLASSGASPQALIGYSGWSIPPRWARYDGASGAVATVFETKAATDYSQVRSYRLNARSADGTSVPVTVLALAGVTPNGSRPAVLTGYGGFGIAVEPEFLGPWLAWLERGGVFALANIRGGSEYGEGWHEGGMLGHKQHVFDDFHAAARALINAHWTDSAHLGIEGGSNGGLLMGATLTQQPQDYRAVVSLVGIYDMLRSQLWPNGEYNISEYGTVKNAADFAWLSAYSPLLHVKPGTAYSAVLLITGENDPRVAPWQSRKFAAALQASGSPQPILLLTRRNEGHGVTSSFSQRVGNEGVALAFLAQQLGLPSAAPADKP